MADCLAHGIKTALPTDWNPSHSTNSELSFANSMGGTIKVDFLGGEAEKLARRRTATLAVVFSVVVGLLASIGAGASYRAAKSGTTVFEEVGNLPVLSEIRRLAWGDASNLRLSPDDRLNVLLLGVGGEGHNGAQLTDTILFVSADFKTRRVGLVSIPRDLAFPLGGGRFMKINAVNAYAEQSRPGYGARDTAAALAELFATRIDHVIRVDFKGFETFIDALGGIDVDVERAFTDNEYPTDDFKWTAVGFDKGRQRMDGAAALKFARSRHGTNGEGSDFARSARQEKILAAVKDKLLSRSTLLNPDRVVKLYEAVAKNVQTDLTPWDMVKLAPLIENFSRDAIVTSVLTDAPDGELAPATVEGAFMLFPKKQDWSEIREIIRDPFKTKDERLAAYKPESDVRVEIKNGTYRNGFAALIKDKLAGMGYRIENVSNAEFRGYEKTVIFDLSRGGKPKELARLKQILNANVSNTIPAWLANSSTAADRSIMGEGLKAERVNATDTDFLIVLGNSSLGLIDGQTGQ